MIVSLEVKLSLSPTKKSSKVQEFEPVFYCFKFNNYVRRTFSVPSNFAGFIVYAVCVANTLPLYNIGVTNPRLKGDDCKSSPASANLRSYPEEREVSVSFNHGCGHPR